MDTFVKLTSHNRVKYLGLDGIKEGMRPTSDSMGWHLKGSAELLSGEEAGQAVEEVKMNQLIKIRPAMDIKTFRNISFIGFNPKLGEFGAINCSSIAAPGEPIELTLKSYKNFNLSELDYVFTLYMAD